MNKPKLSQRLYVSTVALFGVAILIWAIMTIDPAVDFGMLLQLMVLNAVTQFTSRNIVKTNSVLGVSQAVNLATVALYGVQAGVLVGVVASSSVWLYQTVTKQKHWRGSAEQLAFNSGMEIISTAAAGLVLIAILNMLQPQLFFVTLVPWVIAATLHDQLNLALLSGVLFIQQGVTPLQLWLNQRWSMPINISIGALGGLLLTAAVGAVGWQGILLFLFPIILSAYSFMMYSSETEKQMAIISERTEQLEFANNRMQDLAREKNQMLAVLSHDMRTSLSAIHASTQILTDPSIILPKQKQQRMLNIILQSEQTLTGMVDNILRLEKVQDHDTLTMERSFFAIAEVVEGVVNSMETLAAEKQIRLHYYSGNSPVFVDADRQMIQQIVMNLVSNAIKYTPNGGSVFVSLSTRGNELIMDVEDTGYGIPKQAQAHIFEPYYRVAEHEHKALGTGLGLSIVKKFIEAHGGDIEVESVPAQGSRFSVRLPMLSPSAEIPLPVANKTRRSSISA